jgi:hypothetical protein
MPPAITAKDLRVCRSGRRRGVGVPIMACIDRASRMHPVAPGSSPEDAHRGRSDVRRSPSRGADGLAQFRAIGVVQRRKATARRKKIRSPFIAVPQRPGIPVVSMPQAATMCRCFPRETRNR